MKLSEARSAYEALSGKASDIVRQLSLAAIGLVWIFKVGDANIAKLDIALIRGAALALLALFFDLLQYLASTAIWHVYFSRTQAKLALTVKPNALPEDEIVVPPGWLNVPSWIIFWLKASLMITAYAAFFIPFLWVKFMGS